MTYLVQTTGSYSALAALADPTRRVLLSLLRQRPQSVGELAKQVSVTRPAVSQHLKVLKAALLVNEQRQGLRHNFSLNPAGFGELREYVDSMWQDALNSFASHVSAQKKASRKRKSPKREV